MLQLSKTPSYKGFSLIELLVIIAILTIVLLIRFKPSQQTAMPIKTATNAIMSVMQLAKSYAITNNAQVIFCIQKNMICQDTDNWHDNWLVFVDKNTNKQYDTNEEILLDETTISHKVKIALNASKVTFKGNGRMNHGTFVICSKLSKAIQWVVFSYSGRFRISLKEQDHKCP